MVRTFIFLVTVISPAVSGAQQVIPKGSWVLVNTAYPGLGVLDVYPNADACKSGWRNSLSYALADMNAKIRAAQTANKNADSFERKVEGDDAKQMAALKSATDFNTMSNLLNSQNQRQIIESSESVRLEGIASEADYAAQDAIDFAYIIKTASCIEQ